jgi:predicted Fe-Mo cluster-binding NifX family protein
MVPITLSVESADTPLLDELVGAPEVQAKPVSRARISGGSELSTVLLTLTPLVLVAVVKILKEKWARNAKVTIEARGVKIKGASPEDVERILKQILAEKIEDDD